MKKIKILYVLPRLAKAGTERHVLYLAHGLNKEKFSCFICCLLEKGQISREFDEKNFRIISFNKKSIYDFSLIFRLYRLIKREKFDIVHSYLFGFDYLAAIAAKIAGVSVILSSRRELAKWQKWYHKVLQKLGNAFTDRIIACSQSARDYAILSEHLAPERITVIYNGVNLDIFCRRDKINGIISEFGLSGNEKIVGTVANFSAVKDHETLLLAIKDVKKVYPGIKCLLVGDGILRRKIETKILELGLSENVIICGRRDDIPEILSVLDVFALTSKNEGLPNALLEAMSSGIPVVAARVGGIPEAIEHRKSGMLVEPRNPHAAAQAIITILSNEQFRKEMGTYARKVVEEKFTSGRMKKEYEDFYTSILDAKRLPICPICDCEKTKFIFEKDIMRYYRCKDCKIVFIWPQPKSEEINSVYQQLGKEYYVKQDRIEIDYSSSFQDRLSKLEIYRKNNRLLDIGCSIGAFMSAAKNRGWDTYGVEISFASASYAKDIKGLNVFNGTLEDAGYEDGYFDVVNAWGILEHVKDPMRLISEVYRVLRKGGVFVFTVPNFKSLIVRVIGKNYRYICPLHLFYFTKETISYILDDFGFKDIRISSEYFSPINFYEDLCGITPDTKKTQLKERQILEKSRSMRSYKFILRPLWKVFMYLIKELYLGEDIVAIVVKR